MKATDIAYALVGTLLALTGCALQPPAPIAPAPSPGPVSLVPAAAVALQAMPVVPLIALPPRLIASYPVIPLGPCRVCSVDHIVVPIQ